MAFLRTLGRIGDTIGDVLAQAVVGPDYKTKARFLARQKILEMQDAEENLMTKRSLAQQRKLADVKNLIEFATQGANVSETSSPTGSVIPPKISEGMDGALEAGPSTDVMSSEVTSQVPDLPEGVTDPRNLPLIRNAAEQESIRRYRKQQLAQLNQESMMGSREAQAALARARTLSAQSGKPLEEELAQATLDLRRAQTVRAGREPQGRQAFAQTYFLPDGRVLDYTAGSGQAPTEVPGLTNARRSTPSFGEARNLTSSQNAIAHLQRVRDIFQRDPSIVGPLDKTMNWLGHLTGNPNLNAVEASQLITRVENEIMAANIGSARTQVEIDNLKNMLTGGVLTSDPEFAARLDGLMTQISDDFSRLSTARGFGATRGHGRATPPAAPGDDPSAGIAPGQVYQAPDGTWRRKGRR